MSRPTTPLPSSTLPPSSAPPAPQLSPFRSTTAPVKKHHHHHHHIPHRHHHHRDKSVPQSAILPSSTSSHFDSLLSPLTKVTSRTEGAPDLTSLIKNEREARARREAKEKEGNGGEEKERGEKGRLDKDAMKRGREDVGRMKKDRKAGEEALSTSLRSLSTLTTSTTRRLDYIHYSLLSHISSLHSTISSLSSLSSTTSSLLTSFSDQTSALEIDLTAQISLHANNTETQSVRLEALEKRMRQGRQKVQGLGQRMEKVRSRVREQQRREGEWSGKVRMRVRMCWGALATALVLCVLGLMWEHWPRVEKGVEGVEKVVGRFANRTIEALEEGDVTSLGKDNGTMGVLEGETSDGERNTDDGDKNRVLRMLDEL